MTQTQAPAGERVSEVLAKAIDCASWPEWLQDTVNHVVREADEGADLSTEQCIAFGALLALRRNGEVVAWLRDIDGTGSLHPASKGDPGAFPVYANPVAFALDEGIVERLERTVERCESEARLNDNAASSTSNTDAAPMIRAWATDKRQLARDIRAILSCIEPLPSSTEKAGGEVDFAKSIAEVIREESLGGAACGWRSCTGCHETSEGAETGRYPYSELFQCVVGSGCHECGGIGAVWEYWSEADLAEMAKEPGEPLPSSTADAGRVGELEAALRNIAEGNLGDASWQANYDRIRQVARLALQGGSNA